jgi:phage terminase large subunit-like protein
MSLDFLTKEQKTKLKEKIASGELTINDPAIKKLIIKRFDSSPLEFAKHILKEHRIDHASPPVDGKPVLFESPPFHHEVLKLYNENNYIAICAPRGHAKSTLTSFFYILHCALYQKKKNIVIVSDTEDAAKSFLRRIKDEIETNKMILWLFGPLKSDKWSETEVRLANGVVFHAKGRGAQLRGLLDGNRRPDLIVLDDIENEELVRSQIRRLDVETWLNGTVLPTLEPGIGQVIFIGTILHEDSLLARVINPELYPDFTTKRYQAIDQDTDEILWPERFPRERLTEIKESYISRGQLARFYMEYLNDPIPVESATFKREYIQYFDEVPQTIQMQDQMQPSSPITIVYVDLGGGSIKAGADPTAMVAVSITRDNNIYVNDYINDRMGVDTDRIISSLFNICDRNNARKVVIEKTMATNMLLPALEAAMRKKNIYLNIELISPTRGSADRRGNMSDGKFQRISSMEAAFKLGIIRIRRWMKELEEQLLAFPRAKHDDLCLVGDTVVATNCGNKFIKDITTKDRVLTPFGFKRVTASEMTGVKEIYTNGIVSGTNDHPVFHNNRFIRLDAVPYGIISSSYSLRELIIWQYKKLLYSMESPTDSWEGKESIISVSRQRIKGGRILKDFMSRFGNFTAEKKFLKVFTFTTKTVIHLTIALKTWKFFQLGNIISYLGTLIERLTRNILRTLDRLHRLGTNLKKEELGTVNTVKKHGRIERVFRLFVSNVKKLINLSFLREQSSAQENVVQEVTEETTQNGLQKSISVLRRREKVYNVTVQGDHVFYANGQLVGNCDALAYGFQHLPRRTILKHHNDEGLVEDYIPLNPSIGI